MRDGDLLKLTQWLSPAFPVGGFAYSHGLEAAVSAGDVTDAGTLKRWLSDVLWLGAGRADAVLLMATQRGGDLAELTDLAAALAASRERWEETLAQGRAFGDTVEALTGRRQPEAPLAIAVGHAARMLDLDPVRVAGLYLHAFASNLVSGAVRFVPLGQTEGQGVLAALHPLIEQVAAEASETEPDAISNAAVGADLAAMAHETLEVRIFKT
ncbi:MAG: urease accessory UreF family protein [Pseudomonadota bacterium]